MRTALNAARKLGEPAGQAFAYRWLGRADAQLGRFDEARLHLEQALNLYGALDDPTGQAGSHLGLARVNEQQHRHRDALRHARLAYEHCQTAGHRAGQASALNAIGWYHGLLGDL